MSQNVEVGRRKKVSVVVVAQKGAEGLLGLVASARPQLKEGDEMFIVVGPPPADAPSDMTREVADEIARQLPFVRVLINKGRSEASGYETGLRSCKGDHIFLAEPGDIWAPDKIAETLAAFSLSDVALILHDAELFDAERATQLPSLFTLHEHKLSFHENLLQSPHLKGCFAFTEAFRKYFLPFPPEVSRLEKWMGLVAERFGGVALITRPLIKKTLGAPGELESSNLAPGISREERRELFKALKKRERELRKR
ncbi:MAG: glycosyltransferase [Coriobacteriales bacterium]|nr:glycosyltransferase [Coriobacteriales bacterium]